MSSNIWQILEYYKKLIVEKVQKFKNLHAEKTAKLLTKIDKKFINTWAVVLIIKKYNNRLNYSSLYLLSVLSKEKSF